MHIAANFDTESTTISQIRLQQQTNSNYRVTQRDPNTPCFTLFFKKILTFELRQSMVNKLYWQHIMTYVDFVRQAQDVRVFLRFSALRVAWPGFQNFKLVQISQIWAVELKIYNQQLSSLGRQSTMSILLIPQEQFHSNLKPLKSDQTQNILASKQKSGSLLIGDIFNNELKSLKQTFLNNNILQRQEQCYILIMHELSYNLKGLISIKANKKKPFFSFFVDILDYNLTYYKPNTTLHAIQICRNILAQNSYFKNASLCLKLDPAKRQIKVQLPLFLSPSWPSLKRNSRGHQTIGLIFKSLIKPQLAFIQSSLKNILRLEDRVRPQEMVLQKPNKILNMAKSFSQICNIQTHIPCQPQCLSIFSERFARRQNQSILRVQQNKVGHLPQFLRNHRLFSDLNFDHFLKPKTPVEILAQCDQKFIRHRIGFPVITQNQENFLVFNKIYLKQLQHKQIQKISEGGFAEIYLTQINFWHIYQADGRSPNPKRQNNLLTQRVVIKREKPNVQIFQSQRSQYSRKEHQFKIIQKMKQCRSIYLPKYYFPTNNIQQSSFLASCLLIQYISYKTLADVIKDNSAFLSLHSKLCLMFSICQSLRYLRDFNIVHLDLKPNNIITYYNFYVKLIDFGESYHPQVCINGYRPGFTIPYSAPEIFDDKTVSFLSKSDVFSMGVIFYQLLFNRLPFNSNNSTTKFDQEMQQYQHHWYECHEEIESYGESEVLRVLIVLIGKCLSFAQENRPELDWIALILKLLIEDIN